MLSVAECVAEGFEGRCPVSSTLSGVSLLQHLVGLDWVTLQVQQIRFLKYQAGRCNKSFNSTVNVE